jgi:hypothetical protein
MLGRLLKRWRSSAFVSPLGDPRALGYARALRFAPLRRTPAGDRAVEQIADWLQKLGLGQYAQRFAENDINFAILPDLTDQDLKEIGVASLGHRRQLLRAITELKGGETGAPKPFTKAVAPTAPHDTAERRQVTVMFSDLVGSTALSARMDPEDLREVISSYQKCVAEPLGIRTPRTEADGSGRPICPVLPESSPFCPPARARALRSGPWLRPQ